MSRNVVCHFHAFRSVRYARAHRTLFLLCAQLQHNLRADVSDVFCYAALRVEEEAEARNFIGASIDKKSELPAFSAITLAMRSE